VNNDEALFTRLLYFGTVHLNRTEEETWLMPLGWLLDLIECHRQHLGFSKPNKEYFIDDLLPFDTL
jgi:hypothetical protein